LTLLGRPPLGGPDDTREIKMEQFSADAPFFARFLERDDAPIGEKIFTGRKRSDDLIAFDSE
jgi:hypothetical protein